MQGVDRTGSPIGSGSCSNCHLGGNFGTEVDVQLLKDGETVRNYIPGETYTLRVEIATTIPPNRYGFQAVALSGEDNVNGGSFGDSPSGTRLTDIDGRTYFEHSTKLTSNRIEIDWIAPASGSGDIRFYASGNAVNNASGSGGDDPDMLDQPLTISESTVSNTSNLLQLDIDWMLYPNPAQELVNVQVQLERSADYDLRIIDQQNRVLQLQSLSLRVGENQLQLDVNDLPGGIYYLQLYNNSGISTRKLVKY